MVEASRSELDRLIPSEPTQSAVSGPERRKERMTVAVPAKVECAAHKKLNLAVA